MELKVHWTTETGEDSEPMPGSDAPFVAEAGPRDPLAQESVTAQLIIKALLRIQVSFLVLLAT